MRRRSVTTATDTRILQGRFGSRGHNDVFLVFSRVYKAELIGLLAYGLLGLRASWLIGFLGLRLLGLTGFLASWLIGLIGFSGLFTYLGLRLTVAG